MVSVIMTSHNSAPWIEAAIESALGQEGWPSLELVVIDDASHDETPGILRKLATMDGRLRPFFLQSNHGAYRARNIGMSISRGPLITFLDSDDTCHSDRVRAQAGVLVEDGLIATTCNYVRVDSTNQVVPMGGIAERQSLASLMFKRQVLADIGWFDSVKTSADDEFFERIRFVYGRSSHANIPRAMYVALHRAGSLSTSAEAPVVLSGARGAQMLSPARGAYVEAYRQWYAKLKSEGRRPYMPFNFRPPRPFPIPPELALDQQPSDSIEQLRQ